MHEQDNVFKIKDKFLSVSQGQFTMSDIPVTLDINFEHVRSRRCTTEEPVLEIDLIDQMEACEDEPNFDYL